MKTVTRRALFLMAGASMSLAESMLGSRRAQASFRIELDNNQQLCSDQHGKIRGTSSGDVCIDTDYDRACEAVDTEKPVYDGDFHKEGEKFDASHCTKHCFLTTACVDQIGLADDCVELQTLRSFRDNVLVKLPDGAADIKTYYNSAPEIVRRLAASPNARLEYARLYFRYIIPSVLLARFRLNALAHQIYRTMMMDLASRQARGLI
jgi:hypothetical protein